MTRVMYSSLDDHVKKVAWLEICLHSFARVGALFALILSLSVPTSALAIPLQITGQYTGQVNGVPIIATATGQIDTTGSSLNHFEVAFQSVPSSISPFVAGNSWNSSYQPTAVLPSGGALNLFDLSGGGDYIASRTVRWSSLPGEQIVFNAVVSTTGGIMTATQVVNGTYSGPTDLIGVTNYQTLWTQIDPTIIEITSTATLLRANGQSFGAEITSIYSGLSTQMPTNQQAGTHTFSNQSFSNNIMSFDWRGTVAPVPVPAAVWLLGSGLLGLLGVTRQRG